MDAADLTLAHSVESIYWPVLAALTASGCFPDPPTFNCSTALHALHSGAAQLKIRMHFTVFPNPGSVNITSPFPVFPVHLLH